MPTVGADAETYARIIGINNRNLNTLEIDLGTFERLAPLAKGASIFLVAECGVHCREDAHDVGGCRCPAGGDNADGEAGDVKILLVPD